MLRFAIKAGLAGGAVYFLKEEGVWKQTPESLKVYDKINASVKPYAKQVEELLPVKLPQVPPSGSIISSAKQYWNLGVMTTFQFLSELPQKTVQWTDGGINHLKNNPEIKKLLQGTGSEQSQESSKPKADEPKKK